MIEKKTFFEKKYSVGKAFLASAEWYMNRSPQSIPIAATRQVLTIHFPVLWGDESREHVKKVPNRSAKSVAREVTFVVLELTAIRTESFF